MTKSKFSKVERRSFTRQICEEASRRRELFVPVLFIDGKLVSYRLTFRRGRVIYDWITSYATEFRPHSVGGILLLQMFAALSHDFEVDEYNFMRGEEPYKFEWTQTISETITLVIKKVN